MKETTSILTNKKMRRINENNKIGFFHYLKILLTLNEVIIIKNIVIIYPPMVTFFIRGQKFFQPIPGRPDKLDRSGPGMHVPIEAGKSAK